MREARVRLALAAGLFLAWTGWLIYQAARTADPVVVSRPQVLAAPVIVEAQLRRANDADRPTQLVDLRDVLRGHEALGLKPGERLPEKLQLTVNFDDPHRGWRGEGLYYLCLEPADAGPYRLVRPPFSPGYDPRPEDEARLPLIYPVSASTRTQLEEALKDKP